MTRIRRVNSARSCQRRMTSDVPTGVPKLQKRAFCGAHSALAASIREGERTARPEGKPAASRVTESDVSQIWIMLKIL